MAQYNLARAPPANRQEITHPAADHEPCRTSVTTQEAIGIENRTRIQAVSVCAGDDLAAVQMSGQDQVIAAMMECFPNSRVMSAQDADVPIDRRRGIGAGDCDHSLPMRHSRRAVMDPSSAGVLHGVTD